MIFISNSFFMNINNVCYYILTSMENLKAEFEGFAVYFSGMYIELLEAPIPGLPWRTGLLVMAYSPR